MKISHILVVLALLATIVLAVLSSIKARIGVDQHLFVFPELHLDLPTREKIPTA